jgi:hypothetical protein
MLPLRVELDALRYALAVQALQQARRSWHQLDAALVQAGQADSDNPHLATAGHALATLDRHLDQLAKLLGAEKFDSDELDCGGRAVRQVHTSD